MILAKQRTVNVLLKKGYTQAEIDGAIADLESERPFFDFFITYIFPVLLQLLESLILSKRANDES